MQDTTTRLLFYALLIHTLIVLLYGLLRLIFTREKRREALFQCLVMLLSPFVGMLFFVSGALCRALFFRGSVDLEDVIFRKTRKKAVTMAHEEEMDFVPLEEAITVTDKDSTRNLMLEIAKYDVDQSLSGIRQALNADDSELSHYAAAVLQAEIDTFRVRAQKMIQTIEELEAALSAAEEQEAADAKEPPEERASLIREEIATCHRLFSDISKILEQKVISPAEVNQYMEILEQLSALIEKRDVLQAYELEAVILQKIDVGAYDSAEEWCRREEARYPAALSTYTTRLKLYFTTRERDRFFEWLEKLKHSGIPLDHKTLEMIRLFL